MTYYTTHRIIFRNGEATAPYRLTRSFRTERGALLAGERHAAEAERYYDRSTIATHAVQVYDETGRLITCEAC